MSTAFKWQDFCRDHNFAVRDRGKGTAQGHVYLSCPWCPDGGAHQHMGLSMTTTFYGCWKDPEHRGINPVRLIRALLDISWPKAKEIALAYAPTGLWFSHEERKKELVAVVEFQTPDYVTSIFSPAATNYLALRGVSLGDFHQLGGRYGGNNHDDPLAWRVTLPVETCEGKLVGITGRHVGASTLRYLTLPKGGSTGLVGCRWAEPSSSILIVAEGPFDALKLQIAARVAGLPIDVVAILGQAGAKDRIAQVHQLSTRYEHVAWALDDASYAVSVKFAQQMPRQATAHLCGAKDPATLSQSAAIQFLQRIQSCAQEYRDQAN